MRTILAGRAPPAYGGGRSCGSHFGHSAGRGRREWQRRERIAAAVRSQVSGEASCMRDLQDSVERVLQEVTVVFLSDLVKKKLLSEGMQVSDDECKRLAGHALRGRVKRFRLKQPRDRK